mmetsp:Transcript_16225/g.31414  ORF Transcript_16225/g.31414 Transcript_16225/m.31414 type:complete len:321 (+) Transcript_16225:78-1040(+)
MGRGEEIIAYVLPVRVQHALRDSRRFGKLVDQVLMAGAAVLVLLLHPRLAKDYLLGAKDSIVERNLQYGPGKRHRLDAYGTPEKAKTKGVLIFVHGGAWGMGCKEMYALHAMELERQGFMVLVLNYRLYPWARSDEQADDVRDAVHWAQERYPDAFTFRVMAHSSGAHVSMLAAIADAKQGRKLCDGLLLLSGPYDIAKHYDFERNRGVHEISFMKPANGHSLEEFHARSPNRIVKDLSTEQIALLPHIMLLHGGKDDTVPVESTLAMEKALNDAGHKMVETHVLDKHDHVDIHTDFMIGDGDLVIDLLSKFVTTPQSKL